MFTNVKDAMKVLLGFIVLFVGIKFTVSVIDWVSPTPTGFFRTDGLPSFKPDSTHYAEKNPALIHLELSNHNSCTAFVIDNNYAVTAAHCLSRGPKQNKIQNLSRTLEKAVPVKTVGFNERVDYGLIMGDFSAFNHALIAPENALGRVSNQNVFLTCGFPEGQTRALCTEFQSFGPSNFMIVGRGEVYPGMSGGPAVFEATGLVIGVVVAAAGGEGMPLDTVIVAPLTGFLGAMGIE